MTPKSLVPASGLATYDSARFSHWVPQASRVHADAGMAGVWQRVPPGAKGNSEVVAPPLGRAALLVFANAVPQLDCRLADDRRRLRLDPWDAVLLPGEADSWWSTSPQASDEVLHLHVDDALLLSVIEDEAWPAGSAMLPPLLPLRDPRVARLARCVLEVLLRPERPSHLIWETLAHGMARIMLQASRRSPRQGWRGGLAPRQRRRVTDHLMERLAADVALAELAAVAGLSPHHFLRAFKRSIGMTPYAWLAARRMERAQALMLAHPAMGLGEIALAVGYASQTAFGAAFKRVVGATPADWRRSGRG